MVAVAKLTKGMIGSKLGETTRMAVKYCAVV
jgi:hypothetical protein